MDSEPLAIRGGPRTVKGRFPSLAFQLRHGLRRSGDLLRMLALTLRGSTTQMGGATERFERAFAELTGASYALASNSGTAALHSAYVAVGVGPGSEVIVPSYTWHATATPILACGAVPVFCEIDPETLNVDLEDVKSRITERTRALAVLHAWGNPAPMDRVVELAESHGISVVEDCSHAHGARYQGRSVGTWGDVGCFSLQGSKPLEGGEAGVAITNDARLFDRMLLLGHNARVPKDQRAQSFDLGDISLGVKYRPHAASMYLALGSLRRLSSRNARAAHVWSILCEEIGETRGLRPVPTQPGGERAGYYFFVLDYGGEELGGASTEEFVAAARAEGVPIDLDQYRDALLHRSPLFTSLDRRELGGCFYDPTRPWEENLVRVSLPVTERTAKRLVRLPTALWGASDDYVRDCARALKKVAAGLVPESAAGVAAAPGRAAAG